MGIVRSERIKVENYPRINYTYNIVFVSQNVQMTSLWKISFRLCKMF